MSDDFLDAFDDDEELSLSSKTLVSKRNVLCLLSTDYGLEYNDPIIARFDLEIVAHDKLDVSTIIDKIIADQISILVVECRLVEALDDLKLIRSIRSHNSIIPIIALSENENLEYVQSVFSFGASDYVASDIGFSWIYEKMVVFDEFMKKVEYVKIQNDEMAERIEEIKTANEKNRLLQKDALEQAENYAKKLEVDVSARTAELRAVQEDLSEMLNNMTSAVFTFDASLKILPNYSAYARRVFNVEDDLVGRDAFDLLFDKSSIERATFEQMKNAVISCFGMDTFQWDISTYNLVKQTEIKGLHNSESHNVLRIRYFPILLDNAIRKVMIVVEDITSELALLEESRKNEEAIGIINELIQAEPQVLGNFFKESFSLIEECESVIADAQEDKLAIETVNHLFRIIHTIKGNTRTFKLNVITENIHNAETVIERLRDEQSFDEETRQSLVENIASIRSYIENYRDQFDRLKEKFSQGISQEAPIDNADLAPLLDMLRFFNPQLFQHSRPHAYHKFYDQFRKALQSLVFIDPTPMVDKFNAVITDVCTIQGKEIAPLTTVHPLPRLPKDIFRLVDQCLIHLVRNSADHGIEDPNEREAQQKPRQGQICLSINEKNKQWQIVLRDDGRGLDAAAITASAIKKGVLSAEQAQTLTKQEMHHLIFHPGFSTAEQVSEISGRGVGLDFVKDAIGRVNGQLEIETTPGGGVGFHISIPMSA